MQQEILFNEDNIVVMKSLQERAFRFDLIYADMIYENKNLDWLTYTIALLKENGILIVQTDYHTVTEVKTYLDKALNFVNWCIYLNEWGGTPKNRFAQKHDDILIYCNGSDWKFHSDRIQIPKKTAGTAFDKKGTGLKTPCSVFYDHASFSTMAGERVRNGEHNITMQKPEWLMKRLLLPFTDEEDWVLDIFMGSGTLKIVSKELNRNYIGVEIDPQIFELARER